MGIGDGLAPERLEVCGHGRRRPQLPGAETGGAEGRVCRAIHDGSRGGAKEAGIRQRAAERPLARRNIDRVGVRRFHAHLSERDVHARIRDRVSCAQERDPKPRRVSHLIQPIGMIERDNEPDSRVGGLRDNGW